MSAIILGQGNPDSDSIVSRSPARTSYTRRGLDVVACAQGLPRAGKRLHSWSASASKPPKRFRRSPGDYLFDYSGRAQAPAVINDACLKGIVDYHKLGDLTSTAPIECVRDRSAAPARSSKACVRLTSASRPRHINAGRHALRDPLRHGDLQVAHVHPAGDRKGRRRAQARSSRIDDLLTPSAWNSSRRSPRVAGAEPRSSSSATSRTWATCRARRWASASWNSSTSRSCTT